MYRPFVFIELFIIHNLILIGSLRPFPYPCTVFARPFTQYPSVIVGALPYPNVVKGRVRRRRANPATEHRPFSAVANMRLRRGQCARGANDETFKMVHLQQRRGPSGTISPRTRIVFAALSAS